MQENIKLAMVELLKLSCNQHTWITMDSVLNEKHLLLKTAIVSSYQSLNACTKMAVQLTKRAVRGSNTRPEVDLDRDQLLCTKTLGVGWLANEDIFTLKTTYQIAICCTQSNIREENSHTILSNRISCSFHHTRQNATARFVDCRP